MSGLGDRIRTVRGTRSQEELASIFNVNRATIGSWEIGRREPDIDHLIKLADLAGVSLDWLSGRDNTPPEKARIYNSPEWRNVIDIATSNNVPADKVAALIKAALALKT